MRSSANLQITIVGISVIIVVGSLIWFGMPSGAVPDPVAELAVPDAVADPGRIAVHVSGAVVDPALVDLPGGSRVADAVAAAGGAAAGADLASLNLASPVRDGDHVVVPLHGVAVAPSVNADGDVDLNRAEATDLERLPGVGPVLAQRIVDHRESNGPFRSVEDLLDVPGIGEAKLAQMREAIASP